MLSVVFFIVKLSGVRLNIVLLSVVEPTLNTLESMLSCKAAIKALISTTKGDVSDAGWGTRQLLWCPWKFGPNLTFQTEQLLGYFPIAFTLPSLIYLLVKSRSWNNFTKIFSSTIVFNRPAFDWPAFDQPAFGWLAFGRLAFGQPAFDQLAFDWMAFGQPAFGQPAFGQPAFGQPAFGQPAFGQPAFGQPAFGQPAFGQLAFGRPAFGRLAFGQMAFGWPAFDRKAD